MPKAGQKRKKKEGRKMSGVNKICRCITFPVGLSIHGSLAVAEQGNGDAARRLAPVPIIKL